MSLAQHVTNHEGNDREEALVDLFVPPLEREFSVASERRPSLDSAGGPIGHGKTLRKVISYNAFAPPGDKPEVNGGLTPYHVSTAKRIGELNPIRHIYTPVGRY